MILDKRQSKIVKNALNDYDFIKEELENKIKQNYNLEELAEFLVRFKDVEITTLDGNEEDYYLDFLYKDLNMYVSWHLDKGISVCNSFEIYDKEKMEYIIEDFCTKKEYQKMILKDFKIEVSLKNDKLYIGTECSSGEEYKIENADDIIDHIKHYIECVERESEE